MAMKTGEKIAISVVALVAAYFLLPSLLVALGVESALGTTVAASIETAAAAGIIAASKKEMGKTNPTNLTAYDISAQAPKGDTVAEFAVSRANSMTQAQLRAQIKWEQTRVWTMLGYDAHNLEIVNNPDNTAGIQNTLALISWLQAKLKEFPWPDKFVAGGGITKQKVDAMTTPELKDQLNWQAERFNVMAKYETKGDIRSVLNPDNAHGIPATQMVIAYIIDVLDDRPDRDKTASGELTTSAAGMATAQATIISAPASSVQASAGSTGSQSIMIIAGAAAMILIIVLMLLIVR